MPFCGEKKDWLPPDKEKSDGCKNFKHDCGDIIFQQHPCDYDRQGGEVLFSHEDGCGLRSDRDHFCAGMYRCCGSVAVSTDLGVRRKNGEQDVFWR